MMAYVIAGLRRNRRPIYVFPRFYVVFVVEARIVRILRNITKVINTNRYCKVRMEREKYCVVFSNPLACGNNTFA